MELYDDKKNEKKSKAPIIIIISIIILVILTICVGVGILYLKDSVITIKIDGVKNSKIEKYIYRDITEEGTELYIPIIEVAEIFGYKGFNGDYNNKSEDKTQCYVKSDDEVAMFSQGSDTLVKITNNSANEYVKLDKTVIERNGELYTTIQGIEEAFNVAFFKDEQLKNINIYTMDFLLTYYTNKLKITNYSTEFNNKKAILDNMIITENGAQGNNKQYGVIDISTEETILEDKYDEIKYLPSTKEFMVKSNNKYGIIAKDKSMTIKLLYDEMNMIDSKNGLYLVKQNNAYGIFNINGKVIIEPKYKQIGIDAKKYAQNGIENQYILMEEFIPIKDEKNMWAIYNIKGEKITDFKYSDIGCEENPVPNSYGAVVIPSYKIIVVKNDKYYNLVNSKGEEMIEGNILNSVYIKIDATTGENKFYMTSSNNTKVININDWLVSIGE